MLSTPALCACLVAVGATLLWARFARLRASSSTLRHLPLPPGPRTSWTGNVDIPQDYPWITYHQWKDTYGDIVYINKFANPIVILNSMDAIRDLFEKRSGRYSSRPNRTMMQLCGFDWLFSSMLYGSQWKSHRHMFHRHFPSSGANDTYRPLQLRQTHVFLRSVLSHPESFYYQVRRTTTAIILDIIYGHEVAEQGDYYVSLADEALEAIIHAGMFGTFLVDYLPWLQYVPRWFPGAAFKRRARQWKLKSQEMVSYPYQMLASRLQEGIAVPCLVTQELDFQASEDTRGGESEQVIKNVAATTYAAGSDTTVSAMRSFFLAMALHPETQAKAQTELDGVCAGRLPLFSDRPELPYIDHICYELLRWQPVTPLGLARTVGEDDEYRGYLIPKGTTIMPNVWGILHDENRYPDPMAFKPERFEGKTKGDMGQNEIPEAAFGFGRRICPGRFLAFETLWIFVASTLAVYDIRKAVDSNGHIIEPPLAYESTLISHPLPFACDIRPRSDATAALIRQTADES
ncbi:cytochrome P450 [Schizophyllum amplum]|uniref:Cytochrome P450 n=1 Tax=Schizophyllum amplum TaxID=97359 RepID=A0A550CN24_9AGAR|nr:cytochrome P450 [Auriculariopsis ampla]